MDHVDVDPMDLVLMKNLNNIAIPFPPTYKQFEGGEGGVSLLKPPFLKGLFEIKKTRDVINGRKHKN